MKIKEIIHSLKLWKNVIENKDNNYALLDKYMNKASHFIFTQKFYNDCEFIHAYPGIVKNKLKIFLTPGQFDTRKEIENIEKSIEICDVIYENNSENQLSDPIDPSEAVKRIKCWKKDCKKWIPKQAGCAIGFTKCYMIPMKDIESNDGSPIKAYFALKEDTNSAEFVGDLVLQSIDSRKLNGVNEYYDTIKLVPPFRPIEDTYLLEMSN